MTPRAANYVPHFHPPRLSRGICTSHVWLSTYAEHHFDAALSQFVHYQKFPAGNKQLKIVHSD